MAKLSSHTSRHTYCVPFVGNVLHNKYKCCRIIAMFASYIEATWLRAVSIPHLCLNTYSSRAFLLTVPLSWNCFPGLYLEPNDQYRLFQTLAKDDTSASGVFTTRTVLGVRDFAVFCAVVCNSLPTDLRVLSLTVATFAKHL